MDIVNIEVTVNTVHTSTSNAAYIADFDTNVTLVTELITIIGEGTSMSDLLYQPTCVCQEVISVYKARDLTIRVTLDNDDISDLTGAKLWFGVKKELTDTDTNAVIVKKSANNGGSDSQAQVTDGTGKIVEFYIIPDDSSSLDDGEYICDAVIELSGTGEKIQLLTNRSFVLYQPVMLTV